jgi:hypothetical protein
VTAGSSSPPVRKITTSRASKSRANTAESPSGQLKSSGAPKPPEPCLPALLVTLPPLSSKVRRSFQQSPQSSQCQRRGPPSTSGRDQKKQLTTGAAKRALPAITPQNQQPALSDGKRKVQVVKPNQSNENKFVPKYRKTIDVAKDRTGSDFESPAWTSSRTDTSISSRRLSPTISSTMSVLRRKEEHIFSSPLFLIPADSKVAQDRSEREHGSGPL